MKNHIFFDLSFIKRIVNIRFYIFLLTIPILNSCFELVEEIDMSKDGSGKMILTFNLSQSKAKAASIMLMDSINGHKVPSKKEIQQKLNELAVKLKTTTGVSNVTTTTDFTNYIATVSFNFNSTTVLNKTYKEILNAYKIKVQDYPVYNYDKTKSIFSFQYKNTGTQAAYNKLKTKDKEVFKNATYTSIYRFSTTINKVTNQNSKISKSNKAVMSKYSILDIIYNKTYTSNQIQLTK